MPRNSLLAGAGLLAVSLCGLSSAKPVAATPQPKPFTDVLACRAITEAGARLACFDQAVDTLANATKSQNIAVVDRQEVREARRSLFGFAMPAVRLFGFGNNSKEDDADEAQLDTTLRSAHRDADSRLVMVMADGAVWRQIDDAAPVRSPHEGSRVRITHGALGSFFVHIDGQSGFKARRER